eukprot:CAMPEP_0174374918 /NCGR_PEP_ID=MMETSP0811_2-20130205/112691_1 /TAXON_ID=73025 ORGANISM="Eutreptiella gymnastica-like, Strain CCMP1594" /NCGR_SAMPLE_ID=MMETSP0811_2 /ASSEMBLY_ACC=CAM_ASM_000667 /LENGTH=78 /DNA_ID=CAMNT_0015524659 /DNA_START=110 /DNA_END=342 /DNA_ORIENTATION=+
MPLLFDMHSFLGILFFIPASWISFNLVFNYFMVVRTPPGSPVGTLTEEEMEQMKNEKAPKKGKGWTKFCKHCKVPKPP